MFFSIFIILIPGFITARCTNNLVFAETKAGQGDSVTSLNRVRESYKLSGKNLTALAKKILYKKTPQEDMYLYLLRPAGKTKKALPAIVYFTGGDWVNGNVEGQIANAAMSFLNCILNSHRYYMLRKVGLRQFCLMVLKIRQLRLKLQKNSRDL